MTQATALEPRKLRELLVLSRPHSWEGGRGCFFLFFLVGHIFVTMNQVRGDYESQIASSRKQARETRNSYLGSTNSNRGQGTYAMICKSFDISKIIFWGLGTGVLQRLENRSSQTGAGEGETEREQVAKAGRNGCNPPFVSIGMEGTSTCTSTVIAETSSLRVIRVRGPGQMYINLGSHCSVS